MTSNILSNSNNTNFQIFATKFELARIAEKIESKVIPLLTLNNGQVLIGRTSLPPIANSLTGTADQITITNGAGTITLSLPQDIANTSNPEFSGLYITGDIKV